VRQPPLKRGRKILHNWIDMRGPESPLSVLINDFRIAREAKLSEYTVRGYMKALNHLDELMGHPILAGFTSAAVSPIITAKRKTSPSHARLIASVAKAFGTWLATTGLTPENPVKDLGVPKFNGRRRAFSDIEFRQLLRAVRDLPNRTRKRDLAVILLAVGSGLRSNEMRQLAIGDTHINQPLSSSWAYIRWDTSKSQYERRVRIAEDAAAAIHDYIASDRPDQAGPLFLNSHGQPFTYLGWGKMWGDIGDRLERDGVKGFNVHRLRHEWATLGARAGMTYSQLAQEGGWARGSRVPSVYIDEIPFEELQKQPSPMTTFLKRVS
jgi:integrase